MNKEYSIHQLYPFIHWPSFFNDWSYDPQYAKIASLQGCDVVRASWLSDFAEDDRTEASDAMQLLKEANRMIDLLNRDYKVKVYLEEIPFEVVNDEVTFMQESIHLEALANNLTFDTYPSFKKENLVDDLHKEQSLHLFITTTDDEVDLLFENDNYKRKLVQTLAKRLTEAASICLYNEVYNTKESKVAYIDSITKDIKKQLLKNNLFNQSSLMDIKITDSNSLSPNATRIGLILANYILYL